MYKIKLNVISLVIFINNFANYQTATIPHITKKTCGYEMCEKSDPKKLNIHLVAHSHDDVGWLKTVEQYFYGTRRELQIADVQCIINSAIEALKGHPDRRFIYVETAFLWKWWQTRNESAREDMRTLINNGQLEIIGGGWSMNDEATTYYQSTIDQYTWGFRRLNDTFGECARPKIGWQIDPFGHSREQASLFAQFGFDGMFIGRLDYEDKLKRLQDKTAEFMWNGSPNLGKLSDLFSVVLYHNYGPPPGFCYDILCHNEPLDDSDGSSNNINQKIKDFYMYVMEQARHYTTNNIILTMGGDFNYQNAEKWYTNLDKLIRYTNKYYGTELNVFYSTPSCYLKSVNNAQSNWTTKIDDFFPYRMDKNAYWTGFYTSRPTLKYFERMGNNLLQAVKQLAVSSQLGDSANLDNYREVMGIMQHHDAITGTEQQHVAADYAKLLHKSIVEGVEIASAAIGLLSMKGNVPPIRLQSCLLLNISSCAVTEDAETLVVTAYNPTSYEQTSYIRIPVCGKGYTVRDPNGRELSVQLVPIPSIVRKIPGRESKATRELIFSALLPALGYKSFYVKQSTITIDDDELDASAPVSWISNHKYNISVKDNGEVMIKWKDNVVEQSFEWYESAGVGDGRASGAYIFRPKMLHDFPNNSGKYEFFKGPLVQELHLKINDYISQVVRIYNKQDHVEMQWLVGPIPQDRQGREIITKYKSNLQSAGVFYTDSNGRDMIKRVRDSRATFNIDLQEPIAGNYYPVTSKISLHDELSRVSLSILNDRSQGGSSIKDGELELMLHRKLVHDDVLGVSEVLREQAYGKGLVARGTHYLFLNNLNDESVMSEKHTAITMAHEPLLLFAVVNITFDHWRESYATQRSGLRKPLPGNVQILTYEPWKDWVLLRLEHLFEVGVGSSESVEIDLTDLFMDFEIISVRETTLGGNQWIEEMNRLNWKYNSRVIDGEIHKTKIVESPKRIILRPTEIRTFIITHFEPWRENNSPESDDYIQQLYERYDCDIYDKTKYFSTILPLEKLKNNTITDNDDDKEKSRALS